MKYQILHGDNRVTLKTLADNSVDAIVTDPPYGIDFLGKAWDANTGAVETYAECLRVLKPGGHILAFSAARTYHHLAVTLEQAGFEIRDQIMWIYSSGFPKSQDIGKSIQRSMGVKETKKVKQGIVTGGELTRGGLKTGGGTGGAYESAVCTDPEALQWAGWGTCLKPAHEPIALARKPIKLSIARNCQAHGTGALNIDATRIPYDDPAEAAADAAWRAKWSKHNVAGPVFQDQDIEQVRKKQHKLSGGKGTAATHKNFSAENTDKEKSEFEPWEASTVGRFPSNVIGDIPLYQKYFYCPKVSRRERHVGFDPNSQGNIIDSEVFGKTPVCLDCGKTRNGSTKHDGCDPANIGFQERRTERSTEVGNNHPTVKPIELMKYLIKLVTPPGGTVLDPFSGSGSTGCAAVELGMTYIGCELDARYVDIARRRIDAWYQQCNPNTYNQLFVA